MTTTFLLAEATALVVISASVCLAILMFLGSVKKEKPLKWKDGTILGRSVKAVSVIIAASAVVGVAAYAFSLSVFPPTKAAAFFGGEANFAIGLWFSVMATLTAVLLVRLWWFHVEPRLEEWLNW